MPRFRPEPSLDQGTPKRTAVLLVNLGTPDAPTKDALRAYLREFLSDRRVVEVWYPLWWLILNAYVLNTRPKTSAHKYESVWTSEGSPLKVHTERQTKLLRGYLGHAGHPDIVVAYAMRYGRPSLGSVLEQLRGQNCKRILVFPLYPQYAASTTASVFDEVARCMARWRNVPEMRLSRSFADDSGYVRALAASVREHWIQTGRPDKLVISFHGVPRFSHTLGDPYYDECQTTAKSLADALALAPNEYCVAFQSRFGRAEWLKPYTQETLESLAMHGLQHVDVLCPGFISDCLETLEEIAIDCKSAFLGAGGKQFHYVPCLNERPDWIAALADAVRSRLGGWLEADASAATEKGRVSRSTGTWGS
jgi:ferrochelatase